MIADRANRRRDRCYDDQTGWTSVEVIDRQHENRALARLFPAPGGR
jgi:hypothetical protein